MKRLGWGVVALVVVASAAGALKWRAGSASPQNPAGAAQVVHAVRRDISSVVKATGVIRPRVGAEVRVGSRISGVVKRLYVQVGDAVEKGHLLAELDDRDLIARRDEA